MVKQKTKKLSEKHCFEGLGFVGVQFTDRPEHVTMNELPAALFSLNMVLLVQKGISNSRNSVPWCILQYKVTIRTFETGLLRPSHILKRKGEKSIDQIKSLNTGLFRLSHMFKERKKKVCKVTVWRTSETITHSLKSVSQYIYDARVTIKITFILLLTCILLLTFSKVSVLAHLPDKRHFVENL